MKAGKSSKQISLSFSEANLADVKVPESDWETCSKCKNNFPTHRHLVYCAFLCTRVRLQLASTFRNASTAPKTARSSRSARSARPLSSLAQRTRFLPRLSRALAGANSLRSATSGIVSLSNFSQGQQAECERRQGWPKLLTERS